MDKIHQQIINDIYNEQISKLEGGTLYGVPIDTSDMKMVVAALHFMHESEIINNRYLVEKAVSAKSIDFLDVTRMR